MTKPMFAWRYPLPPDIYLSACGKHKNWCNDVKAAEGDGTQPQIRELLVSIDMVKSIVVKYGKVDAYLEDLRISFIVLLRFARSSDLMK